METQRPVVPRAKAEDTVFEPFQPDHERETGRRAEERQGSALFTTRARRLESARSIRFCSSVV